MQHGNQTKTDYLFIFIFGIIISSCILMVTYAKEPSDRLNVKATTEQEISRVSLGEEIMTWKTDKLIEPRFKENKPIDRPKETSWVQILEGKVREYVDRLPEDWQNEIISYLWELNKDPVMIWTFIWESWLRSWAVWWLWEKWICQLMPQFNPIVKDKRFTDWKFQADFCVSKWKVAKHSLWSAYSNWSYKKYLTTKQ